MLARCSQCLVLSAMVLAGAQADVGPAASVTVETNLARKPDRPEGKERQDRIWSAVILATNSPNPKPPPPELRAMEPHLKRTFGYNQFEIVGTSTEVIDEENEHWLVPSRRFSLAVKARRAASEEAHGGYLLNLELFQEKRSLVSAVVKIAPGSPLPIRGPACDKGQILIILQVLH